MSKNNDKLLEWVGSSKKDLMALPLPIIKFFGHALDIAQRGGQHDAVKVLKGFAGAGVLEIVENDQGGTYRAVYTVKFKELCSSCIAFNPDFPLGAPTSLLGGQRTVFGHFDPTFVVNSLAIDSSRVAKLTQNPPR